MSTEKRIEPDKIHIVSIKTLMGNINSTADVEEAVIAGYQFDYEVKTGTNRADMMIGMRLTANIDAVDSDNNALGITGSYTHEIIFKVENLEDFISEGDENGSDNYLIDAMLGSTLVSIAYSTVRGIIYTRTQGTSLGSVILPVINPKQLLDLN